MESNSLEALPSVRQHERASRTGSVDGEECNLQRFQVRKWNLQRFHVKVRLNLQRFQFRSLRRKVKLRKLQKFLCVQVVEVAENAKISCDSEVMELVKVPRDHE